MKKEALASKKPAIRYFESSINTLKDHCGNKHTRKVLMKELGKIRLEKNENIASDLISAVLSMRGIRSDHLEPNLAFFKEQMNGDNIGNISDGNNSSGKLSLLNENLLLFVDKFIIGHYILPSREIFDTNGCNI